MIWTMNMHLVDRAEPPILPRIVQLLGAVLLFLPIFFTFEGDNEVFGIIAFLVGAAAISWILRKYPIPQSRVIWCWIVLAGYVGVQTVLTTDHGYFSVVTWTWWLIDIVVVFLAASWSRARNFLSNAVVVLFMAQVVAAGAGLILLAFHPERVSGFLYNANGLGGYLIWGFFLIFTLLGQRRFRWWIYAGSIIIILAFFLTVSISSFAAAALPLIIWAGLKRKHIVWRRVGAGIAIVVVLLAGAVYGISLRTKKPFMDRLHGVTSITQRLEFDRTALAMWQKRPWFGWGLGTFQKISPQFTNQYLEQPKYTHNVFLQLLAETGIFGATAFMALVLLTGLAGWRMMRREQDPSRRWWMEGFFFGWLAFTIAAALDFGWFFPAGQLWWFVISGMFLGAQAPELTNAWPRRAVAWTAGIIGIGLIGIGLVVLVATKYRFEARRADSQTADTTLAINIMLPSYRMTHSPEDAQFLATEYLVRRKGDDLRQAEKILRDALQLSPGDYSLHYTLGRVFIAENNDQAALAELKQSVALDPKFHPDFIYDTAMYLDKLGKTAAARTLLDQSLKRYATERGSSLFQPAIDRLRSLRHQIGG